MSGPRASEAPGIYGDVFRILEQTIQIFIDEDKKSVTELGPDTKRKSSKPPTTVAQAVERLISGMSFKDKTTIANTAEVE